MGVTIFEGVLQQRILDRYVRFYPTEEEGGCSEKSGAFVSILADGKGFVAQTSRLGALLKATSILNQRRDQRG